MIDTSDFKTGLTIELDGDPCKIVDFQHVKPGKGAAFVRTKIKNLKTGASIERTFRPGEKFQEAVMERKQMEYLYFDGEFYVFMDNETFEQSNLTEAQLDGGQRFLKENMVCLVTSFKGEVMEVELPNTVELRVVETEPSIKGSTVTAPQFWMSEPETWRNDGMHPVLSLQMWAFSNRCFPQDLQTAGTCISWRTA